MKKIKSLFSKLKNLFIKISTKIHVSTLDLTLVIVVVLFIKFNMEMINLYKTFGSMPETYACAVVVALIGECGICGRIFTTKIKYKERKMDKELDDEFKKDHPDDPGSTPTDSENLVTEDHSESDPDNQHNAVG